jgi:hypothetical protein
METIVKRDEWRWAAWVAALILLASWLPYLAGWIAAPADSHFTGIVYNPLDGQTYIAKMRLGAEGSWLLHLVYTPESQHGVFIFLFYLLLGHVARWTGLPLLAVYHGARTVGGLALLFGLYRLVAHLSDQVGQRRFLFLLTALGAGLGWLAAPLGRQTPDVWVSEAFPFASLLTNAHFPIALALMVWMAHWGLELERSPRAAIGLIGGAAALGVIQPFGLPTILGGLVVAWAVWALRRRAAPWRAAGWLALTVLLALPYPLYTVWAIRADPILAAWNAQNLTPSLPLVDWLLGLGVLGPLALVGGVSSVRQGRAAHGLIVGWALATVIGLALPLDLSRRLSLGMGIPVGLLAGLGWGLAARRLRQRARRLLTVTLVAVATPTALFLLLLGAAAVLSGHPLLYLSDGEWSALAWLREHAPRDAVVLCAPETGIFVPAWAGQRVVYGHPFETVRAAEREDQVRRFWAGERDETWLHTLNIAYFFYGPREKSLGPPPAGEIVFETDDTTIYRP